jgi:hypothetical protein
LVSKQIIILDYLLDLFIRSNLSNLDYFSFPKLKLQLKSQRSNNISKRVVINQLKIITKEQFLTKIQ